METDNVVLREKEDLNWETWNPLETEDTGLDCQVWICSDACSNAVEDEPQIIEPVENDEYKID